MAADFPRFLMIEEAAQRLGVSVARVSLWIGECKLPVAARSEYAGFLLRTVTVETVGSDLAGDYHPKCDLSLWLNREAAPEGRAVNHLAPRTPTSSRTTRARCA